jgi:hypothetical protein
MTRFYAAVFDGKVVASVKTNVHYSHAVIHTGANGRFASFHQSWQHSRRKGMRAWPRSAPKYIVPTVQIESKVDVGAKFA